ncbi:MAG: helix-turn-helix transcriptional regulator [Thermomicrobiales bacterium]|nr:helix-turn-helix transcriptional regulator [Thermomicrobiales bacterium]
MCAKGYGQFCPVSIAAEVLSERWTLLVLRELLAGSTRFNDLHRGVPLMSASLLSQRLRDLELAGLLDRQPLPSGKGKSYRLTEAGEALRPVVDGIGLWGTRYMRTQYAPENLDPSLLMWDMRRWIRGDRMPSGHIVIRFDIPDAPLQKQHYWMVKEDGSDTLDLCLFDPGFPVCLIVTGRLEILTRVWMGNIEAEHAVRSGQLTLDGVPEIRMSFYDWIGLNPFVHLAATQGIDSARRIA